MRIGTVQPAGTATVEGRKMTAAPPGPTSVASAAPGVGTDLVREGGEGGHVGLIAQRQAAAFRELGLRTGQGVPNGVVERLHVRDGVTVTQAAPAISDHLARIDLDGYTIVEDAIEPDLVVDLRDAIRRLERELHVEPKGTSAEGHATRRMYNLLAKDPVFQAMPVHPNVLPIVEQVLDRGCLLSGMTAIDIGPGEDAQPMHGDDIVMSRHLQRPHAPMMVTSMWALDDFTAENGGTLFVPGSHVFPARPTSPAPSTASRSARSRCAAGSVMIFHGSLWHGGGSNTTVRRVAVRRQRPVLPGVRPPAAEPVPRHQARRGGDVLRPPARVARVPPLQGDHGSRRRREPRRGRVRRPHGGDGVSRQRAAGHAPDDRRSLYDLRPSIARVTQQNVRDAGLRLAG